MWNAIAVVRPPNKLLKLVLEDQSQAGGSWDEEERVCSRQVEWIWQGSEELLVHVPVYIVTKISHIWDLPSIISYVLHRPSPWPDKLCIAAGCIKSVACFSQHADRVLEHEDQRKELRDHIKAPSLEKLKLDDEKRIGYVGDN